MLRDFPVGFGTRQNLPKPVVATLAPRPCSTTSVHGPVAWSTVGRKAARSKGRSHGSKVDVEGFFCWIWHLSNWGVLFELRFLANSANSTNGSATTSHSKLPHWGGKRKICVISYKSIGNGRQAFAPLAPLDFVSNSLEWKTTGSTWRKYFPDYHLWRGQ